jgi:hypothetical protein
VRQDGRLWFQAFDSESRVCEEGGIRAVVGRGALEDVGPRLEPKSGWLYGWGWSRTGYVGHMIKGMASYYGTGRLINGDWF